MPTLLLRGLSSDTMGRVRAYATAHGLSLRDAGAALLDVALAHLDARQRGAQAANARLTPEQRIARASHAVAMREARRHQAGS